MASIRYRLASIERRALAAGWGGELPGGICHGCEGLGPWSMSVEVAGVVVRPPARCPRCGAPSSGKHLHRVLLDPRGEEGWPIEDPV